MDEFPATSVDDESAFLVQAVLPSPLPFDAYRLAGQLAASSIALYRRDFLVAMVVLVVLMMFGPELGNAFSLITHGL